MKNKTLKQIRNTALVASTCLLFAGCASLPNFHADKGKLAKSGGIGCAIGGVAGYLFKHDAKGAVIGCVAGGGVGLLASYQEQLNQAKEVQKVAEQAGMKAQVKTKEVKTKEGKTTQAFDGIVIKYNPDDMKPITQSTAQVLDRLATLAKKAKNNLNFTFEGNKNCMVPVRVLNSKGAFKNGNTVDNKCGMTSTSQIKVSPLPELD